MKVLYLANPVRSGTGGDRRSFEVLQRIAQYGVDPVIVVDDFIWQEIRDSNLPSKSKIYRIKRPNTIYKKYFKSASSAALDYFSILKSANYIADIAKKEHVELIVSHHEKIDYLLEAYIAAKKCSLPWTCIFQLPLFPPYASTGWRKVSFMHKAYRFALYAPLHRLATKAVKATIPLAVSPSIAIEMKSYLRDWNSEMLVLRPGVGVENEKIRQIAPSKEKADAIFFSRLVPEKGVYDLPKIAYELIRKKPDLKFLIIGRFGSPAVQNNFLKMIKDNQLGKNIVYKGFLKEEELYSLLKSAKVLIYPSKYDAFPLVVLETLASGTPVIAYDVPAIRLNFPAEMVKTVPAGNYKQMATEALKIIENKEFREKLSGKAVLFASTYSWDNVAVEERQAYNKVLKP